MELLKLQTNVWVVLLLAVVSFHAYIRLNKKDRAGNILKQVIVLDMVLLVLETIGTYFSGKSMIQYRQIHKGIMICTFLIIPNMLIMAPRFLLGWIEKTLRIKHEVPKYFYLPIMIHTILTFATIWTSWLGYINKENEYTRGILFGYVLMMVLFYIGYTVFLLFKYKEEMIHGHFYIGCGVIASIIGAVALQIWQQGILTIWSTIGMLCVCGYIFNIYYELLHDPLTGIENRASYINYIRLLEHRKQKALTVVSIDLDGFKEINDQCGHYEGDKALIQFARLLKKEFQDAKKVIRMGGDEFTIFLEQDNEIKMQQQIQSLKKCLDQDNKNSEKGCFLDFSYGIAVYHNDGESVEAFLTHIDQLMYEQKSRKKCSMKLSRLPINLQVKDVDDLNN